MAALLVLALAGSGGECRRCFLRGAGFAECGQGFDERPPLAIFRKQGGGYCEWDTELPKVARLLDDSF
jgi:hypothetical protein